MRTERAVDGRGEGDRKSFTAGPASSLHSLQKETIMRIHGGKGSRLSREYIVKMQASAHSRKKDNVRVGRKWGNTFSICIKLAETRVMKVLIELLIEKSPNYSENVITLKHEWNNNVFQDNFSHVIIRDCF